MYDELIKRLRDSEHQIDCCICDRDCCYPDGKVHGKCIIIEAADAIEELSKPRWISVEERLPEEMDDKSAYSGWSAEIRPSDDVQVYLASEKRQSVAWYSHTYNEWTTVDENTVYKYGEVTHWMPLPEPPKEET